MWMLASRCRFTVQWLSLVLNVCYWHKADIDDDAEHVRF